jgi:DNA-binding NarL/FixJ family response regulator
MAQQLPAAAGQRVRRIAAVAAILARCPGPPVVVVPIHGDPEVAERAYAGALGYVVKLDAAHELIPAIPSAEQGERYVPRRIREAGHDLDETDGRAT